MFFVTFITWTANLDKLFNRYPWFFLWKQAKQLMNLLYYVFALTHNSIYLLLSFYFIAQFTFHRTQVHKIIQLKEWKMVNFKLGETNVKMKWSACHEGRTKKKSESLTGFQPMTSQTLGRCSLHFEPLRTNGEQGHVLGSYLTCVLHTTNLI